MTRSAIGVVCVTAGDDLGCGVPAACVGGVRENTWSWGNWWARGVPVVLEAGVNTIALYNDPANSATADGCPSPCMPVLDSEWAPNLDRFQIAPIRVQQ